MKNQIAKHLLLLLFASVSRAAPQYGGGGGSPAAEYLEETMCSLSGKEFDDRAAGLLANDLGVSPNGVPPPTYDALPPEAKNWVDNGGFCCCQDENNECPVIDFGDRIQSLELDIPIGRGEPCPRGKTKCCFKNRKNLEKHQDVCTPVGQSCPEPKTYFDDNYMKTVHPISIDCTEESQDQTSEAPDFTTQEPDSNFDYYDDFGPRQDELGGVPKCGERNFKPLPNRQGGQASPGEFPWMCLVLGEDPNRPLPNWDLLLTTCVIVPETFDNEVSYGTNKVLTVTHRINNVAEPDKLKVRIVEFERGRVSSEEGESHKDFTVGRIQHFQADGLPYGKLRRPGREDLTMLKLTETIDLSFNNHLSAACYPTCDDMFDVEFKNGTGTRCWVSGWGKDTLTGKFATTLKKVDVPIWSNQKCQPALKNALKAAGKKSAKIFNLHESEVCAGGEPGKDACDGDGGAPLVCEGASGRWYVVGLVAWGESCGQPGVPGVYSRISYFKDFINNDVTLLDDYPVKDYRPAGYFQAGRG